jgi:hypothetical protein
MKHSYFFAIISLLFFSPAFVSAHQPYLVDGEKQIVVIDPEVSKAYYGEFNGTSTEFMIREEKPFELYLNILVPAIQNIPTNITALVKKDGKTVAFLEASSTEWVREYEPYGGDDYFKGPEFRTHATSGTYTVTISRPENSGKYVLVVGEKETFTFDEMLRAVGVLPSLKSDYMDKPAWTAYFNRIGIFMLMAFVGCIIAFFILGEIVRGIGNLFGRVFGKPKHFHD